MSERTYDYGTHECLDRTAMVMHLFSSVQEHPQVVADPTWSDMADKAMRALMALYQSIGNDMELPGGPYNGIHLPPPPQTDTVTEGEK
jgi:hypothetical protein